MVHLPRRRFLAGLGGATLLGATTRASHAQATKETIKIGSSFPKSSPWGIVFETWAKAVASKSAGKMELQFFHNGVQGDDDAMVGKVKAGQLDGAAVSGIGLGKIYKPILALQMPGLFSTWGRLDTARDALKDEFEKGAKDAGFSLLGWFDIGLVRAFSKGFALKAPGDFKGKKPVALRSDSNISAVYSVLSVSGVPLSTAEVLPNLNMGSVNALFASPLHAEQMQWGSKLDNLNVQVMATHIGGLAFSSKRIEALPEDLRNILLDTGKVAANALTKKIRSEDDAAFSRLKGKMTVATPSSDEKSSWDATHKLARQKLASGTFTPELVAKLEGIADTP